MEEMKEGKEAILVEEEGLIVKLVEMADLVDILVEGVGAVKNKN